MLVNNADIFPVSSAASRRPWCMRNSSGMAGGSARGLNRHGARPIKTSLDERRPREVSFLLDDSFALPFEGTVKPSELRSVRWMKKLRAFIRNLPSPRDPVILVAVDDAFVPALVNWLIASQLSVKFPLENVLIITYDEHLCPFLETKDFSNCLSVPLNTILHKAMLRSLWRRQKMTPLLIARISVMRILNKWGIDVVNLDSDAVVLKNPVPLFGQYPGFDIIGTFGGGLPQRLSRKWGLVLCMGAVLVRSSAATETLWGEFRKIKGTDDQVIMNYALSNMKIQWTHTTYEDDYLSNTWHGRAEANLSVFMLPQKQACRHTNCQDSIRDECYIWHQGNTNNKIKGVKSKAAADKVWFVRKDCAATQNSNLTGLEWLKSCTSWCTD